MSTRNITTTKRRWYVRTGSEELSVVFLVSVQIMQSSSCPGSVALIKTGSATV